MTNKDGTNSVNDGLPVIIYEYNWSTLFGLVFISLTVEDRRPDLTSMIGKFKHQIRFRFFHKKVCIVTRSTSGVGRYVVDGETAITSVQ